jgi:glycine dehydrogenase (decarboxylating)
MTKQAEETNVAMTYTAATSFIPRHIGPSPQDARAMLDLLGYDSLDAMIDATVPDRIRLKRPLAIHAPMSEHEALSNFRAIAKRNDIYRSYLGLGYYDCITPPVIQRNVLENPGWYTAYTPYQAEIAQGRLEALLNFQTMVMDLTGFQIANASLLDEGTAAAEAMHMSHAQRGKPGKETFFISDECFPQTIAVVKTRAEARGVKVVIGDWRKAALGDDVFGALLQYPAADGGVHDYRQFCERAHAVNAMVTVAADLMSLVLLAPPGEWGADVCVGNTQRFGVPLGYGGPHAAFFATADEFKRHLPGRIIGVSRDADGRPALRMALQTREQHIRREKATSNVCTAQVLLAVIAGMYAVYHGPARLTAIAHHIHELTATLAAGLEKLGHSLTHGEYFDTISVDLAGTKAADVVSAARSRRINLRAAGDSRVIVALDETVTPADVNELLEIFAAGKGKAPKCEELSSAVDARYDERFARTTTFLTHEVFNSYHSETEMLRYLKRLENRDLSLTTSMIPLGSCTMKLNATAEMYPITWPEIGKLHPFAPRDQAKGYTELFERLERALAEITGFAAVSLQPNAGSQGEYTGLLVIRKYHQARGDTHRDVCLIPQSAHGTNPASAVMAGMKVVVVKTDANGNIDVADLEKQAKANSANLAALMVTYPSTHGVFEEAITDICRIVHENGNVDIEDLQRKAEEHAGELAALMITYPSTHGIFEEGIVEIDVAARVGLRDDDRHPRHHRARRIGAVRRLRDEAHRAPLVPARAMERADRQQPRVLPLRAGVRLERHRGEPGDLRQRAREVAEQLLIPLRLLHRGERMEPRELRPRDREHLRRGVELHRAAPQRDHRRRERQVARLELPHVPQHLRLGVVRVEHGMRQERTRAREPLVEPVVDLGGERARLRRGLPEQREQLLDVVVGHRLVERDDHAVVAVGAEVDLPVLGGGDQRGLREALVELDAERVEVDVVHHAELELLDARREHRRVAMDPPRDRRQPLGAVPHGVHARHHGEQHLRGAHVRRRLLAPDVLLARLERHAQRRPPRRVAAHADDPARQHPLELVARGEERRVRSAVAERNAEPLRAPDADVGAPLARRREQRERQQIGRDDGQGAGGVCALHRLAIIDHRAVGRRILHEHAEHLGAERRRRRVAHRDLHAACPRPRAHDVDRLRVAARVDEEGGLPLLPARLIRHEHRLRRRGALVEQRRVRDLQTGEIDHHGLEVQQRLEAPLRDLRLVRRVRGVPAGVLEDVPLDHRRRVGIVIPVAQIRAEDPVLPGDRPHRLERLVLGAALVDGERPARPDRRGDGRVDELVERRGAEHGEHLRHVALARPDVARNEAVGGSARRASGAGAHPKPQGARRRR